MGITRAIFAVGLCVYTSASFAALNISGTPSGASNYEPPVSNTPVGSTSPVMSQPTIYGGLAGSDSTGGCATKNSSTTCNNCIADTPGTTPKANLSCNESRIYDNLNLVIPLAEFGNTGVARMVVTSPVGITTPIDVGNSISAVTVPWSALCNAAGGSSGTSNGCEGLADSQLQVTIYIETDGTPGPSGNEPKLTALIYIFGGQTESTGIDDCSTSTKTGVCFVRAYPGDGKLYIIDAEHSGSYPLAGVRRVKKLRVFATSDTVNKYDAAVPTLAEVQQDLTVNEDGSISDRRVKGLTNGKGYYIRVGVVDNANNLSAVTSDDNIRSAAADCAVQPAVSSDPWIQPSGNMNCAYYAKPDEVLGLLNQDMNCFIATAAYGSQTSEYLDMLRDFRMQRLVPYEMGRKFIYTYYKYGPYAARYITEHPSLKSVAQVLLWPVISFSWIALHYGWWAALGSLIASAIVIAFLFGTLMKIYRNKIRPYKMEAPSAQ